MSMTPKLSIFFCKVFPKNMYIYFCLTVSDLDVGQQDSYMLSKCQDSPSSLHLGGS